MQTVLFTVLIPVLLGCIIGRSKKGKPVDLWWAMPFVLLALLVISLCVRSANVKETERSAQLFADTKQVVVISIGMALWGVLRLFLGWQRIRAARGFDDEGGTELEKSGKRFVILGVLYFFCATMLYIIYSIVAPRVWG